MRNESPPHQRQPTTGFLWVQANDRDKLGRCDIVARIPVLLPRGTVEILLNNLLPPRESVPSAHWRIMSETLRTSSAIGKNWRFPRMRVRDAPLSSILKKRFKGQCCQFRKRFSSATVLLGFRPRTGRTQTRGRAGGVGEACGPGNPKGNLRRQIHAGLGDLL
jgi:hypothetical protein